MKPIEKVFEGLFNAFLKFTRIVPLLEKLLTTDYDKDEVMGKSQLNLQPSGITKLESKEIEKGLSSRLLHILEFGQMRSVTWRANDSGLAISNKPLWVLPGDDD